MSKKRRMISAITAIAALFFISVNSYANDKNFNMNNKMMSDEEISDTYIAFSERIEASGKAVFVSLEVFANEYKNAKTNNDDEFIAHMSNLNNILCNEAYNNTYIRNYDINNVTDRGSFNPQWYDYIGVSNPALPQAPSYTKYNILTAVQAGDIIYETDGGAASLTGHIAFVQGKYWDSTYHVYYIRTIEANLYDVVFGVLDDSRYDYRGVTVYSVSSATSSNKINATIFMINQLGKSYSLKYSGNCNTSIYSSDWYCSEVVWAAYYYAGINLNGTTLPYNIYYPAQFASHLTSGYVPIY